MLVGIMSDSHGDALATRQAVELLRRHRVEKIFHCGDICESSVLDALAGCDCAFVWGNCDRPSPLLRDYVATLGLPWPEPPVRLSLDGKRIALYHGHESDFDSAAHELGLDYLFFGHAHALIDCRVNACRLINPGALSRVAVKTVALLDLTTDDLRFLRLDGAGEVHPKQR